MIWFNEKIQEKYPEKYKDKYGLKKIDAKI